MSNSPRDTIKNFCDQHWFRNPQDIYIICSKEPKLPVNALTNSPEYQYVNNFADKDLLLYVYGFLRKMYSNAKIYIKYPYEYRFESNGCGRYMRDNLVLIGGPATNSIVRKVLYDVNCPIINHAGIIFPPSTEKERYNESVQACCSCPNFKNANGEIICERSKNFCQIEEIKTLDSEICVLRGTPKYINSKNEKNLLIEDYGMFVAMDNFYAPKSHRIVLISGLHSLGALGAYRSYVPLDNSAAIQKVVEENYSNVSEYKDFVTFHKTTIERESEYKLNINSKVEATYPLGNISTKKTGTNLYINKLIADIVRLKERIDTYLADDTHPDINEDINHECLASKLAQAHVDAQVLIMHYSKGAYTSIKNTYDECVTLFEGIKRRHNGRK